MNRSSPGEQQRPGITFASFQSLGLRAACEAAQRAADAGYGSFWTAETTGPEAFATLAHIGAHVDGLDLGTGVLAVQLRTPPLAAMGAATLQEAHPDRRILLGVGISSPVVVGRWHGAEYGDRPVARMRSYLGLTRACLTGERVDQTDGDQTDGDQIDGDHPIRGFRLGVRLGERRPELVLGALNERMLRLAGEAADGVLLNYLPASAVPWCVEQVRAGESAAGRPAGSCTVFAYVHVGVCDPLAARPAARRDLFSYAVVPAYATAFARAGYAEEIEALRAAREAGDRDAAVAAMSDRMCDQIDVCGDAAHIRATVGEYRSAGVDVPVIMPLPWGEDRRRTIDDTIDAVAGA
ncbi:MAG: LLM class flavin-dependent oxidoreductase [Actinomycetota bacterium]